MGANGVGRKPPSGPFRLAAICNPPHSMNQTRGLWDILCHRMNRDGSDVSEGRESPSMNGPALRSASKKTLCQVPNPIGSGKDDVRRSGMR